MLAILKPDDCLRCAMSHGIKKFVPTVDKNGTPIRLLSEICSSICPITSMENMVYFQMGSIQVFPTQS